MASSSSGGPVTRGDKVLWIFDRFDANGDGGLDRSEMAALVAAVNPSVNFTSDQIAAILDEVFRSYSDFVTDPSVGLSLSGLLQTYDDGAGDVVRDFSALSRQNPNPLPDVNPKSDLNLNPKPNPRVSPAWASSPNHGISYEGTWKVVEDLEILIRSRIRSYGHKNAKDSNFHDGLSENGWSAELSMELEWKRAFWEENLREFSAFSKELHEIRVRIDQVPMREEAFDGHMGMGMTLYDHMIFAEALQSFRRAAELRPTDVRPHYRMGNTLCSLGQLGKAKESYLLALELVRSDLVQWALLLPQIHVNLGIILEGKGLLINASEHYREAVIQCPTHYRALKLLGSALFGVGEYGSAVKALEEAVLLKPDYTDAHCDLGSALHAMGEEERAVLAFQKAIDLKPDHLDTLYNLGSLFKEAGRYHRAAEMYGRVVAVRPDHWRAQLNRAVSLLGAGEVEEANRSLNEAFRVNNRVELRDAITTLKQLQWKPKDGTGWIIVQASKITQANQKTTQREHLSDALHIRAFQKITKLCHCDVTLLTKEMEGTEVPVSYSGTRVPERSIRKAALELILHKLLCFLKPEMFQEAVKEIDEKIWSVLDVTGSGTVDPGMFFAILAPICSGSPEKRKQVAFEALLRRSMRDDSQGQIGKADASIYIRYLRVIYLPSQGLSDLMEVRGLEKENTRISLPEFLHMFDDMDWGFGILSTLVKLEAGDKVRHSRQTCGVCRYPIIGLVFKETTSRFNLCAGCYSEGKVPSAFQQEKYKFKEYQIE